MYRGYVSGTSYSYGRQFDMDEYHAADCTARRRMPPRNHISPLVKCLLFSFNFLFWVCLFVFIVVVKYQVERYTINSWSLTYRHVGVIVVQHVQHVGPALCS